MLVHAHHASGGAVASAGVRATQPAAARYLAAAAGGPSARRAAAARQITREPACRTFAARATTLASPTHSASSASASDAVDSAVALPLSLDAPSIASSKLSSYLSLLPAGSISSKYLKKEAAVVQREVAEEQIEHKPLRTRMKSDMKFAVPANFDPQYSLRTLPFSLESYRCLLAQPLAAERHHHADTTTESSSDRTLSPEQRASAIEEVTAEPRRFDTLAAWMSAREYSRVLTVLNELSARGDNAAVCAIYQSVVRAHADDTLATLDAHASGASGAPASVVLSFLHSLHQPRLLDHAAALTLAASMRCGNTVLAREVIGKVARWQQAQKDAFDAVQWSFGVELARSDDNGTTAGQLHSAAFEPYSTYPYMVFIDSLMRVNPYHVLTARGRLGREVRKRARDAASAAGGGTSLESPSAPELPKVKPALQLFNRLVSPPVGGGTFDVPWNRLARTMLRGVVDVAANEARDLRVKHAALFRAADALPAERARHDPLADISIEEIATALEECATKKREALELVEGIALHVMQSFVAGRSQTQAAPTAEAQTTAAPIAEDDSRFVDAEVVPDDLDPEEEFDIPPVVVTAGAASSAAAPPPPAVAQASNSGRHAPWRVVKLLMCARDSLRDLESASTGRKLGGNWNRRQAASLTRTELQAQRAAIHRGLMEHDAIFTSKLLDARQFEPTAEVQRAAQRIVETHRVHTRLLHSTLEAFIHVARDFSKLEGAAERLRTRAEYRVAHQVQRAAEEEVTLPGSLETARAQASLLHSVPLPPSPAKSVHAILSHASGESASLDRHALTLLFHKALFGGGLRAGVRYATFSPEATVDSALTNEAAEFDQASRMLEACGPSYRRIPIKVRGATSDFVSSLLIDQLLPRPVSLHDTPRTSSASSSQPHSKLFETYSTAALNVLEKQRRRVAKEDLIASLMSHHTTTTAALSLESKPSGGRSAATKAKKSSPKKGASPSSSSDAPAAVSANFPFTVLRDTSGVLARLHGALEYVYAHPLHPSLDRHITSEAHQPDHHLTSAYLSDMRFGLALSRAQRSAQDGQVQKTHHKRRDLKKFAYHHRMRQQKPKRDAAMLETRRADYLALFRKSVSPRRVRMPDLAHAARSFVQIPSWVVPRRTFSDLLVYYDRCNDLPSAVQTLDRMRHQWVTPSFEASLALVSLAGKFMNYELLTFYLTKYALPASGRSSAKRARIWRTIMHALARYNSYSNVDVYMRYVQELMHTYLLQGYTTAQASEMGQQAPISDAAQSSIDVIQAETSRILGITTPTEEDASTSPAGDVPALVPAPSSMNSSVMRGSFNKRALDDLWGLWVSRGGVNEVLASWKSIRTEQRRREAADIDAVQTVVLDDHSVDAFLNGLLATPVPGKDAVTPLTATQLTDAVGLLLRHLATHGLQLTSTQQARVAIDLPLLLSKRRGASDSQSLHSSFAGGSAPLRAFAAAHGVPDLLVEAALASTHSHASDEAALRAAAFDLPLTPDTIAHLTPSSLRARVVATQLRDLTRAVGPDGVDVTIDRLERILTPSA